MRGCELCFNRKLVADGDLAVLDLLLGELEVVLCELSILLIVT